MFCFYKQWGEFLLVLRQELLCFPKQVAYFILRTLGTVKPNTLPFLCWLQSLVSSLGPTSCARRLDQRGPQLSLDVNLFSAPVFPVLNLALRVSGSGMT